MIPYQIIQYSTDFLEKEKNLSIRSRSKRVSEANNNINQILEGLFFTLQESGGVGLAAPQVGIQLRIFIVNIDNDDRFSDEYKEKLNLQLPFKCAFINPKIIYSSKNTFRDFEGCLSIPGVKGYVPRSSRITIRASNANMESFMLRAEDFLARVIQHEQDHMNGILYIDRMESSDELLPIEDEQDDAIE